MRRGRAPLAIFLTALLLLVTPSTWAQPQEGEPEVNSGNPETIEHQQPAFFVRAEVNHISGVYREGEALSLRVICEVDAFLYVLYKQADGQVFQIFPNAGQPENRVAGKEVVSIPAPDDLFRWRIGPPFGREVIKVLASREPIAELSTAASKAQQFNPVSATDVKSIATGLTRAVPTGWAEHQVEIITVPDSEPARVGASRRIGIFFGVSKYEFHEFSEQASGRRGMNLAACDRDARAMGEALERLGELDEARLFLNEQATRRRIEETVTQWLPAVSKPGDTIFFYFSGHGVQTPDDNGDEPDGIDELLAPHDYMPASVLALLAEQLEEGKLDDALARRVRAAIERIRRAGGAEQAMNILAREMGVSDDLFGHWLQRLDGRRVVVILDICHAGGFGQPEKGLRQAETILGGPAGFDFLDHEISRLKDIGQRDSALLAACHAGQRAIELPPLGHGVMTYFLADAIRRAEGPLELPVAYQWCAQGMKALFESEEFRQLNDGLRQTGKDPIEPHEPYFLSHLTTAVHLRP